VRSNVNCGKFETLWIPYLDGKLTGEEAARMDAHLAECPECALRREGLSAVSQALDVWQAPEPSPWFDAKLRARIAAEEKPRRASWAARLSPAFSMMMAAMLVLGALMVWHTDRHEVTVSRELVSDMRIMNDAALEDLLHAMDEMELLYDFEPLSEMQRVNGGGAAYTNGENGR
jgi:anti-sigma factor RsiW